MPGRKKGLGKKKRPTPQLPLRFRLGRERRLPEAQSSSPPPEPLNRRNPSRRPLPPRQVSPSPSPPGSPATPPPTTSRRLETPQSSRRPPTLLPCGPSTSTNDPHSTLPPTHQPLSWSYPTSSHQAEPPSSASQASFKPVVQVIPASRDPQELLSLPLDQRFWYSTAKWKRETAGLWETATDPLQPPLVAHPLPSPMSRTAPTLAIQSQEPIGMIPGAEVGEDPETFIVRIQTPLPASSFRRLTIVVAFS